MMQGMGISFHINALLPFAKALQGVVCMVGDFQILLPTQLKVSCHTVTGSAWFLGWSAEGSLSHQSKIRSNCHLNGIALHFVSCKLDENIVVYFHQ